MPKIVKIPLITLAALLMFALLFLAFAQTKWFKNYATDKATRFLSKELGVPVSIGQIELNYFDALTAHDLYIEDQQHDTMIHIAELGVNYDLFSFSNALIKLDEVSIKNAKVYLGVHKGEPELNLQFLIDYFTPTTEEHKSFLKHFLGTLTMFIVFSGMFYYLMYLKTL